MNQTVFKASSLLNHAGEEDPSRDKQRIFSQLSENKPQLSENLPHPVGKKNLSALKLPYSSQGSTKPGSFASQPGENTTPSNASSLGFEMETAKDDTNERNKATIVISTAKLVNRQATSMTVERSQRE
jgi:hypothetical protein